LCSRWDAHDGKVMPIRLAAMITSFRARRARPVPPAIS